MEKESSQYYKIAFIPHLVSIMDTNPPDTPARAYMVELYIVMKERRIQSKFFFSIVEQSITIQPATNMVNLMERAKKKDDACVK